MSSSCPDTPSLGWSLPIFEPVSGWKNGGKNGQIGLVVVAAVLVVLVLVVSLVVTGV